MRYLPLLLVVAGCGSSTSNNNDLQTGAAMDLAVAACARTLDGYCALQTPGYCVRTLAAAQQAGTWCPDGGTHGTVTQTHCSGGQTVIIVAYVDTSDHFVYDSSGALVAEFSLGPHQSDLACNGGPASFAAPTGCDTPTTICS